MVARRNGGPIGEEGRCIVWSKQVVVNIVDEGGIISEFDGGRSAAVERISNTTSLLLIVLSAIS